jgi:hypothetical protein
LDNRRIHLCGICEFGYEVQTGLDGAFEIGKIVLPSPL